jgi:hypothetical protein
MGRRIISENTVAVLEERGRFWKNNQTVPEGHFAPDDSITGLLTVDNDGRVILDLDATNTVRGAFSPNSKAPRLKRIFVGY